MVRCAIGVLAEHPAAEIVDMVRLSEELGYEQAWIADERFYRDPYVTMTNCAVHTTRIKLGVGVTNPYTRHPAVTAAQLASVDEVARGRVVLGIGAGGSNHRMLGIGREKPAVAVREAIEVIRRLLAGETVDYRGKVVQLYNGKLDFRPYRDRIPVYVAARGPAILELAGELADGVIIGGFASRAGLEYALRHVRKGAERAGRSLDDIDVVSWLYTSVSRDSRAAKQAVRKLVVISVINSRPIIDEIGVELPPALRAALDEHDWSQAPDVIPRYLDLLSDELIEQFSVAGTVEECAAKVRTVLGAGAKQLAILPFATPTDSKLDIIRRFREEVVCLASR